MEKNEYLESVEMNTGVEMIPCESSNIEGFGYDSKKKQLWVAFKGNRVYRYDDVPYEICNELHQAESKGKYLAKNIKNKFETTGYEKVSEFFLRTIRFSAVFQPNKGLFLVLSRLVPEADRAKWR